MSRQEKELKEVKEERKQRGQSGGESEWRGKSGLKEQVGRVGSTPEKFSTRKSKQRENGS